VTDTESRPFVRKLDEWRRQRGLGHSEFAEELGVSRQMWWLLRAGKKRVSLGLAGRMSQIPDFAHLLAAEARAARKRLEVAA
jgi:transcriptional regulator with XRE-family HTH domain